MIASAPVAAATLAVGWAFVVWFVGYSAGAQPFE